MAERKAALRAVQPGEKLDAPKIKSLAEAVAGGDYYEILIAQRREIAESIPDEKGPAKAALHRQLSLIAKEIEALEARKQEEAEEAELVGDEAWDSEAI
jgi:hypothetical protein